MPRRATLALLSATAVLLTCARNPVTGKRQLALVSEEQEIALGKQAAEEIVQSVGAYPDPALQKYVESVGMKMAARSERPKLPWRFVVLDDPTVNAFALPGGPVFVTRGILGHLNSEAELAAVLGHEIGHITARHSVHQMSEAQLAQLGLGIGMVVSEDLRKLGQVAGAGLQLLFLRFGRDAERQSDELGFRYMVEQGYDPRQMASVFTTLERTSAQSGGAGLPQWLSTHPDPGDRAKTAARRAAKVPDPGRLQVDRDAYLARVDGIVFGEDPRQGYFRGDTFVHPELHFQLRLPSGWKANNGAAALVASSPEQDAVFQLASAGKLSPDEAARKFFSQEGVRAAAGEGSTRGFEAQTEQGVVRGVVSFVSHQGRTLALRRLRACREVRRARGHVPAGDPELRAARRSGRGRGRAGPRRAGEGAAGHAARAVRGRVPVERAGRGGRHRERGGERRRAPGRDHREADRGRAAGRRGRAAVGSAVRGRTRPRTAPRPSGRGCARPARRAGCRRGRWRSSPPGPARRRCCGSPAR